MKKRFYFLAILSFYLCFVVSNVYAEYFYDKTLTQNGGSGDWGSILKMTASLSGSSYLTITVSKQDGGIFSSSGKMYLKVGTPETYGVNQVIKSVYGGSTSKIAFTHNLDDYNGYPKEFYARYEPDTGGYAWVGPIVVADSYPATILNAPSDGVGNLSRTQQNFSWYPVDDAIESPMYRIVVSTDSSFSGFSEALEQCTSSTTCWTARISSTSYSGFNLKAGTRYYWQVRAGRDSIGGAWSDFRYFTTAYDAPATPGGLAATASGQQSITIQWNSVSDAETYRLFRDTSRYGSFNQQIYWGTDTSYSDSGTHLHCGTTYYYKVLAENNYGQSAKSAYVSTTTKDCCTVPSAPSGLSATADGQQSMSIQWNAVSGATNYRLYRDTSRYGSFSQQIYWGPNRSYQDSGTHLSCGTIYYYKIAAENDCGQSTKSAYVSTTTDACCTTPSTPGGLSASADGTQSLSIQWNTVPGATTYKLYRDTTAGGSFDQQIYWAANSSYQDSGTHLECGKTYYYKVVAKNDCGESVKSNYVSVTTAACCLVPASPDGLNVTAAGQQSVTIQWDAAPGAENYRLYRDTSPDGGFSHQIYWGAATSYDDSGDHLACGTTYYYKVLAENSCGMSEKTASMSTTTQPCDEPAQYRSVCVGDNYEQQMPAPGVKLPRIKHVSSLIEDGKIVLTADAEVDPQGWAFFYWCTKQGELECVAPDCQQVQFTASSPIEPGESAKISVQVGDTLGYIDIYSVFVNPNYVLTVKKTGSGQGTVIVGETSCDTDCLELKIPQTDKTALVLKAIAEPGSHFVRWETSDGGPLTERVFRTQPGVTIFAVFETD